MTIFKNLNIKRAFICLITVLAFFVFISPLKAAPNTAVDGALNSLDTAASEGFLNTNKKIEASDPILQDIPTAIGQIIGAVLAFVGIIFFVLMIYAGLMWMTARGNEEQVTKAKNLIGAAVIGMIIVFAAYAITAFIGEALTKGS